MKTKALQRGHGLLMLVLILAVAGTASVELGDRLRERIHWQARKRSIDALARARAALIGYAISYAERHPGQDYGYLPCPDLDNSGSSALGACGNRGEAAIGRLPWRTLALPELRDASGECLWYAVAGSIKHNPKPSSLNWDSPGQFIVIDEGGQARALEAGDGRAAALVIAPGPALAGQVRVQGSKPCRGADRASVAAADFIEPLPRADGDLRFHAAGSAGNDLIVSLSVDELFAALRHRHDFAAHLNRIVTRAASSFAARIDDPAFISTHTRPSASGVLLVGPMPAASELGLDSEAARLHDNWREQLHVALCSDGSACIEVADRSSSEHRQCRAVLLFGGERIRDGNFVQQRVDAGQRRDIRQYLEADNARNFLFGIPRFAGDDQFRIDDPLRPASEDVVQCLQ